MEDGRADEDVGQQQDNQDRRLKPENPLHHHQQQPQPPQKCPRCDSLNTKFCYYNNYSLSQPRYFCKTCRRYWTQGGTLRNVPVGGGCRKARRNKASSSGTDNSRSKQSSLPQQPPQHQQLQVQMPHNLAAMGTMVPANSDLQTSQALRNEQQCNLGLPSAITSMSSYYSDGGFLPSLAAMQSLSQPQTFSQAIHGEDQYGRGANLGGLLQGLNIPSLRSQRDQTHQLRPQSDFYQMVNRDKNTEQMYPFDQNLIHPSRTVGSWTHSFINSNTNPTASNINFWNSSTSNTSNSSTAGTSSEPSQWPDLPGYGPSQ